LLTANCQLLIPTANSSLALRPEPCALHHMKIFVFLCNVSTVSFLLGYKDIGKTVKTPGKNSKNNGENNCKNRHCFPASVRKIGIYLQFILYKLNLVDINKEEKN